MSKTPPPLPVAPRFERDPAFLDTYATQLRLNASLADFTLVFGVNDDIGPGNLAIRDKVAVHLPPVTAKILALQLRSIIDAYEEAVGEIPLPLNFDRYLEEAKSSLLSGLAAEKPPKATRAPK